MRDQHRPYRIAIVPFPGFALMSYAALTEPLRAANLLAGRPLYAIENAASRAGPVASSGGVRVDCDGFEATARPDMVLAVAGGDPFALRDDAGLSWLRRFSRAGAVVGGVSGGPVMLAKAGLLSGYRVTVHWEHAARLSAEHPGLAVERSLYVIDRDRITCAGGTAPMDLMLALIGEQHGQRFARRVADWFMHTDIRPPSGPQRGGLAARIGTTNAAVLASVAAMEHHVADPLDLSALARVAGVGARQLNRVFVAELGCSTMAWYRDRRLSIAADMLTGSAMPITEIALATGFGGSAHFASAFRQAHGASPRDWRRGDRAA